MPKRMYYPPEHGRVRAAMATKVATGGVKCSRCGLPIEPGEAWDLDHTDDRSGYLGASHPTCNRGAGERIRKAVVQGIRDGSITVAKDWRYAAAVAAPADPEDAPREPLSPPASDSCWDRRYLSRLRRVPADAVWPRLMTLPHPRATGSLGTEFCAWAHERTGRHLRWWQQLVAARLLEVDDDGRLVWQGAIVSTARQVGKSWLLRELCLWRIHQADRFGEPQDVMHTGKDIAVCKEVQRRARVWARQQDGYRVREVNGQEEIEHIASGGRWMVRAKDACYGYSVSMAAVDEAWKVRATSIDEGLEPTMAEREQPQLVLLSTAHRQATTLIVGRRHAALADLNTGLGDDLLIEWSAPRTAATDDRGAWRAASPHWTARREKLIAAAHERMIAGEAVPDADDPDPEQSFKAQWLNQWPARSAPPPSSTERLLPADVWAGLVVDEDLLSPGGPVWVGLEDDYGVGAAVGCCRRCDDGRLELDGWLRADWDSAIADVVALAAGARLRRILVGASMIDSLPPDLRRIAEPRTSQATRHGLALLRDLAGSGGVVHDTVTGELDDALELAHVRENDSGLFLVAHGPVHLVKAAVWALAAAHRPAVLPAIR